MHNSRWHYNQPQPYSYVYDPNDGRPANWLRICKCCNAHIPGGAQFCRHCGTPTRRPVTERYRNRVAGLWLAIMCAVMLIAIRLIQDPFLHYVLGLTFMTMAVTCFVYLLKRRPRQ